MKSRITYSLLLIALILPTLISADTVSIYQTSREGDRLTKITVEELDEDPHYDLKVDPNTTFQTLIGIGSSFTESSGQVLAELSEDKRNQVMDAYFSPEGAHLSMTRTHIASCDFSVSNYSYAPVPNDTALEHFTIERDRTYLLPLIKAAQKVTGAEFKILASPWTAPPWMKTNNSWNAGELLSEHYGTFADYMVKYIEAYDKEGIPIWGITPVNEPLGNGANWESLHFSAEQMRTYIKNHLGPALRNTGRQTSIWIYDQNREDEMIEWAEAILGDPEAAKYVQGTAVHWYQSTVDVGAGAIQYVLNRFPEKAILHSEGCIDAMGDDEPIGVWLEDDWYWRAEATDWGYRWAADDKKANHPKYRPFYRYARDIIGGLNNNLVAWIDWNMCLNTRGGPNHARNYCLAPVLVDSGTDNFFKTPLYYAIAHASKYIRPGAVRIKLDGYDEKLMSTAFKNPDGSVALLIFNLAENDKIYSIELDGDQTQAHIPAQSLQTVVFDRQQLNL